MLFDVSEYIILAIPKYDKFMVRIGGIIVLLSGLKNRDDKYEILVYSNSIEHLFQSLQKENAAMTENELELLYIIRTNENPEKALGIALDLMIDFLTQHEALRDTSSARPRESA